MQLSAWSVQLQYKAVCLTTQTLLTVAMPVTKHVCSVALWKVAPRIPMKASMNMLHMFRRSYAFVSHGLPVVIQRVAEVLAGGTQDSQRLGWQVAADYVQCIKWQGGDWSSCVLQYNHDDSGKCGCECWLVSGDTQLQSRQSSTSLLLSTQTPVKRNGQSCMLRP